MGAAAEAGAAEDLQIIKTTLIKTRADKKIVPTRLKTNKAKRPIKKARNTLKLIYLWTFDP